MFLRSMELNQERFIGLIDKYLKRTPEVIVEIGARDCNETLGFYKKYPNATIFTFECNPATLPICRKAVEDIQNINLIEKAVSDENANLTFYQIDQENTITSWEDGNPGASSLYRANDSYTIEKYAQKEITVASTKLDDQLKGIDVDVIWMDIQGAELRALKGAKSILNNVALIHTEIEFDSIYEGQPLFWDIKKFMLNNGFYLLTFTGFGDISGDAVFINKKLVPAYLRKFMYLRSKMLYPYLFYSRKFGLN